MRLNADIIYQNLSQKYVVKRLGRNISAMSLSNPLFYDRATECISEKVYIAKAESLSSSPPDADCLIICVGGETPVSWKSLRACAFVIEDQTDMLHIHNSLNDIYERYDRWSTRLREILDSSASIAEMISITAPLLGNPIALCNNRIEIEVSYGSDGEIDGSLIGPVSEELANQFLGRHAQNTAMREPFLYKIGNISAYCINIYKQNNYLGLITLGNKNRPLLPGDTDLFDYFFKFVSEAAEKRMNIISGQFITVKSIFHDLLSGLPVSTSIIRRALEKEPCKGDGWVCAAIKLTEDQKQLPTEYLCLLLESRVPKSVALFAEPYIALFLPTRSGDDNVDSELTPLKKSLSGLSMSAGISYIFEDIADAKNHYNQAIAAIETADTFGSKETLCFFRDYALLYALRSSVGQLAPEYMLPAGLLKLRDNCKSPGGADYWETLRVYLDSEMNVTDTARKLFIHRTTLQARLTKLKESVDLSSPYKRLYIRYCIYLVDSFARSAE